MKKEAKSKKMLNLNININDTKWKTLLPSAKKDAQKIAEATFNYLKYNTKKTTTFNLELDNDKKIRHLNKLYRHKDKPTNVLSFACIDDEGFTQNSKIFDEIELGDIIISIDTLEKEANSKGISLQNHFYHLLIHGILHLLGYDHIDDKDAD